MTPKYDREPLPCSLKLCVLWEPSLNSNWSCRPETLKSEPTCRFLVPYDLEIWRMTPKRYRAPLLCHFKLYAIFNSHLWVQTRVTVRERSIRVKIMKFAGWLQKHYYTSSMPLQALWILSQPSVSYGLETPWTHFPHYWPFLRESTQH